MATIVLKKDLAGTYKKETVLNASLLSKLQPIPSELSRLLFKENALEKPTQNLFNNLTYYLISIIDPQVCSSLSWPLYDTKAERAYRSEISNFFNQCSSKGLLSPILSSYLVNPSSYKVTVLLYELSQLAVHQLVKAKVIKESQKKSYEEVTEQYKSVSHESNSFIESIEKESNRRTHKLQFYIHKRKMVEEISTLFQKKIIDMENMITNSNSQEYINDIVDNFISKNDLDDYTKTEILKIKNFNEESVFFDSWLSKVDSELDRMEDEWNKKAVPFLNLCQCTYESTDNIIKRHTGQIERSSYMIEYDSKNDAICTKELQSHVNSEQKFILKNLDVDHRLNFPNLLRGYVIALSYILKNTEEEDEILKFNKYLGAAKNKYDEIVLGMKAVVERILNAESKLHQKPVPYNSLISITECPEIPPLPDLSDLKTSTQNNTFENYSPLNISKHQFNFNRTRQITQQRPFAPFYQAPRDNFLKSLVSCRVTYDHANLTHGSHNASIQPQTFKANETIGECITGFTKQQISRLLTTKKSSSSKKFKYKQERPDFKKKGSLFNESLMSNDSNGLFRSYSSPNLFENREKRCLDKLKGRKLSIMHEDQQFNMSGISSLDIDSNFNSPHMAESSRKEINVSRSPMSIPPICVTNEQGAIINAVLNDFKDELKSNLVSPILEVSKNLEQMTQSRSETPQSNANLIKKTSSLEKIINRFKKVRANVVPEWKDVKTIVEEKENMKVNFSSVNKILLPDLLSPSTSHSANYLDQLCNMDEGESRKPRESLGTALGVDITFLDQFDLID